MFSLPSVCCSFCWLCIGHGIVVKRDPKERSMVGRGGGGGGDGTHRHSIFPSWFIDSFVKKIENTAVGTAILAKSVMPSACLASMYNMSWASYFVLLISREQTNMAAFSWVQSPKQKITFVPRTLIEQSEFCRWKYFHIFYIFMPACVLLGVPLLHHTHKKKYLCTDFVHCLICFVWVCLFIFTRCIFYSVGYLLLICLFFIDTVNPS